MQQTLTDRIQQIHLVQTEDELQEVIGLALEHLVTVYVAIDLLQGYYLKGNSKLHSMSDMAESYQKYDYQVPIRFSLNAPNIGGGDGAIVAGNGRLESVTQLFEGQFDKPRGIVEHEGRWFIPCTVGVNFESQEQAIAYSIDDNSSILWGSSLTSVDASRLFDTDALMEQLQELAEQSTDLLPISFPGDELDLLMELNSAEPEQPPQEDEEALERSLEQLEDEGFEPRCKLGEVWQLGRHRICCGDSTVKANVEALLDGRSPDIVFSDAPYGVSIVATNKPVGGGEAYEIPFGGVKNRPRRGYVGGGQSFYDKNGYYPIQKGTEAEKKAKQKRLGTSNSSKPFGSKDVRGPDCASNVVEAGKYMPIIGDDTTKTAIKAFQCSYELFPDAVHFWWGGNYFASALPDSSCWIVWDKENTGNFADAELAWTNQPTATRIFKHMWNGMVKASEHGQKRVHPTQKPKALGKFCFETYGNEGDLILDQFLGSGMTLMAAQEMTGDRTVFGFELSPEYCHVILERFQQLSGIEPELVGHLPKLVDTQPG